MSKTQTPSLSPLLLRLLDDYQDTEARFEDEELLNDFVSIYGGVRASDIVADLKHLEDQLDVIWPGWRKKELFGHLPDEEHMAIKMLLKHRRHILMGFADWGVRGVWHKGRPLTLSVKPNKLPKAIKEGVKDPRKARVSAIILAGKLKLPLERVEAALDDWDPDIERNAMAYLKKVFEDDLKPKKTKPKAKKPTPKTEEKE